MRATERRQRLRAVLAKHVPRVSREAHLMLNKRFVLVKNDIKVLKKGLDWEIWIDDFAKGLQGSLEPVVEDLSDVENQFWLAKGVKLSPVQVQDIWDAYEARVGRQITGIGETTRSKTLEAIASWQEDEEANYSDLVSNLEPWYGLNRANTIAKTESAFLSSQISLSVMLELDLAEWSVDLGVNACQGVCLPIAENGPYTVQDETPPFHPECDCGMLYIEPLVKRNWLGKINENHDEKGRFAAGATPKDFGMGALAKDGKENAPLREEMEQYQVSQHARQSANWTNEEKAAVDEYAWADPCARINGQARGTMPPTPYTQQKIQELDSLLSKSTLDQRTTVYRGIDDAGMQAIGPLSVGDEISDKAFVSTSMYAPHAAQFMRQGHDSKIGHALFKMDLPAGTHAAHTYDTAPEVLLPRNTKFEVKGVTEESRLFSGEMTKIKVYHLKLKGQ